MVTLLLPTHLIQLNNIFVTNFSQHICLPVQVPHHVVCFLELRLVYHFNRYLYNIAVNCIKGTGLLDDPSKAWTVLLVLHQARSILEYYPSPIEKKKSTVGIFLMSDEQRKVVQDSML